ncbi:E3 SUMO-protein ligase ZBED1-like [Ranitomeya variabilis]|uniref:E3 SUMO-protein ligase ZBED1-like n=2 Tax=Ranitomeya variabilis TaxID=490064 RepID=UPI004057C8F1
MSDSRKRSSIWMHFDNIDNTKAECKICKFKLSYRAGSNTNLHRHIRNVHPTVQIEEHGNTSASIGTVAAVSATTTQASARPRPTTTQSSILQFMPDKVMTPARKKAVDEELAKMIAKDFQPLTIVEDKGFKSFVHALNPVYALPTRKTLSQTLIPKLYERERASLQGKVQMAAAVCLTTDCWTSRATTSFMSVTCHFIDSYKMVSCLLDCFEFSDRHTSENLADELLRVAKEWQVESKVICCVTDNAANITKAIKNLKWNHHPCLAHTLNLIVKDSLKEIKPTVDKVKSIVEFFHKSTTATMKLKSTQQQMGMPELRPKQDCVTRWNSTFHMLKRVLESKDAIISTLAIMNAPVEILSQEEWEVVREACIILEPFDQVTVEISSESYVTASKMLLLCKGLQRLTANHQRDGGINTEKVKELVAALCASMDRKFQRMEYNTILSETTVLDPRFKKTAFTDNRAVDEALQRITAAAARCSLNSQPPPPGGPEEVGARAPQVEPPQMSAVWRVFDERATEDAARRNPSADAMLEVRSYLEEPLIQRAADPLTWWESKASIYPRLVKVMTRRLCIVATSVPSERIFSKAGQIITERRNRISSSKLQHLVFLNANLP